MEHRNTDAKRNDKSQASKNKEQAHIASLLDLQDFLSDELFEEGKDYPSAFRPITEGLGLASPRALTPKIAEEQQAKLIVESKLEALIVEPKAKATPPPLPKSEVQPKAPFKISVKSMRNSNRSTIELRSHENRLADVIETNNEYSQEQMAEVSHIEPPPLPRPGMLKRLFAGIIDQVFVLFIWTGMIVITSNLINDFTTGFSVEIISDFAQPRFQRIAILEFAAAWLGYLGFSLLIFKRTFGMWVWSLGVSYGDSVDENYFLRKAMRIFWTFIFSAPVIPSFLLAIRKNGRNVLDILSGTNIYDAD